MPDLPAAKPTPRLGEDVSPTDLLQHASSRLRQEPAEEHEEPDWSQVGNQRDDKAAQGVGDEDDVVRLRGGGEGSGHRRGVFGGSSTGVLRRQVDRHAPQPPGLEPGDQPVPAPGAVPGPVDQADRHVAAEGAHAPIVPETVAPRSRRDRSDAGMNRSAVRSVGTSGAMTLGVAAEEDARLPDPLCSLPTICANGKRMSDEREVSGDLVSARPQGAPAGLRQAFSALRYQDFRRFWIGAALSNIGTWMQNVTVPYVIFLITRSATWVGFAAFCQLFPGVVLGPVAGWLADRFERRKLLLLGQVAQALLALALWWAWVSDLRDPRLLVVLLTLNGAAFGVIMPAWQAFVTELVPRRALLNAI